MSDGVSGPDLDEEDEVVVQTHEEVLGLLRREGLPGELYNTGGGCLAYRIQLESGRYVLVTSIVDVLGPVRTVHDEGWSAGVYCTGCEDGVHDQDEVHANVFTEDSSGPALVMAVKDLLGREARGVRG